MPGDFNSSFFGATGPVNQGPAPQYNYNLWVTSAERARDRMHIGWDRRTDLRRRFIRPGNYGEAARRIEAPGAVVLLQGPAGIGRSAAAIMLLHEAPAPGPGEEGRFEELELRADPAEGGPLDAGTQDRFLLDLSGTSHEDYPLAQRVLAFHRAAVEQAKARLVVVLPAGLGPHMLDPQLAPLVVPLRRPRALAVVRRALRLDGIPCEVEQLKTAALAGFFADAPMHELARFCATVRHARDSGHHGTGFDAWCEEARRAVTERAAEAAQQVAALGAVEDRALLLTTAMLHGAPADTVFHSRNRLLESLGHGDEAVHGLAQRDLLDQLKTLGIRRTEAGRVAFEKLEYDAAIRSHFWLHFPDLRDALSSWVDRTMWLDGLTAEDRAALAARFSEQVLGVGRPGHLLKMVETWAASQSPRPLLTEAATALEVGLQDANWSRVIRAGIRSWAMSPELSWGLLIVLTEVCRDTLAVTHPRLAVVRLHHLALQPDGQYARTALFDLVEGDPRLRGYLIHRLATHAGPRSLGNLGLLRALFASAALPSDLPWEELARVWRATMLHNAPEVWDPLVRGWLDAVLLMPAARREPALDALVVAATGSGRHTNQLYAITCAWEAGRPERQSIATWLWERIDTTLDLAVADSGGGR
ncbi:hypothetical protein [Streptomyces sp. NPDC059708]|uniref:hypothetical protein n=1 Tax=Streptomyces sp. NPDC059708 TaxID=3346916 RepID=UPI0036C53E0C